MVFRCYSKYDEKICLRFFPCKNLGDDISLEELYTQIPLTVFVTDYVELLLEYITGIYPIKDITNDEIVQSFEECFDNWIGKDDWKKIIEKIKVKLNRNNNRPSKMEKEFYENFIEWIEKELDWADIIVVKGNL
jgi:predicted HAD superfamily phosphohydrolase